MAGGRQGCSGQAPWRTWCIPRALHCPACSCVTCVQGMILERFSCPKTPPKNSRHLRARCCCALSTHATRVTHATHRAARVNFFQCLVTSVPFSFGPSNRRTTTLSCSLKRANSMSCTRPSTHSRTQCCNLSHQLQLPSDLNATATATIHAAFQLRRRR